MSKNKDLKTASAQGSPHKCWRVVCESADDGSGDIIVSLPDELCAALGWAVGDRLKIEPGNGGTMVLSK